MIESKHGILVDLSPATEGFAGIPQESRLLLQSLWRNPEMEAAGLIYTADFSVVSHTFRRHEGPVSERLANQAQYFYALSRRAPNLSQIRLIRWVQQLRIAARCLFGRSARMDRVNNDQHGETIWRLLLSQSLGADGLHLAQNCPFFLANLSRGAVKIRSMTGLPTYSLDTRDFDFLLLHDALPLNVSPGTCRLLRYHDMIPALRPELIGSRYQILTNLRGLRRSRTNAVIVCNSEPTRSDLLAVFPDLEERSVTIPDLLGSDMYREHQPRLLSSIWRSRLAAEAPAGSLKLSDGNQTPPYLLIVSTIEPRKNHLQIIRAYEKLIATHETDLVLAFVGSLGWNYKEIARAMLPLQKCGKLIHLEKVPPEELRILYSHAEAVVFPSFYEGFGYCPLEAMQCGTPSIVSDIPCHRWVYGDAALYCDPFRVESLIEAIERLVLRKDGVLRKHLVSQGEQRVRKYTSEAIGAQWLRLCDEIRRQGGGANVANLKLAKLSSDQSILSFRSRLLADAA